MAAEIDRQKLDMVPKVLRRFSSGGAINGFLISNVFPRRTTSNMPYQNPQTVEATTKKCKTRP